MKIKKIKLKNQKLFKVVYTGGYCSVLDKRILKFAKKLGFEWYASGQTFERNADKRKRDISFIRK